MYEIAREFWPRRYHRGKEGNVRQSNILFAKISPDTLANFAVRESSSSSTTAVSSELPVSVEESLSKVLVGVPVPLFVNDIKTGICTLAESRRPLEATVSRVLGRLPSCDMLVLLGNKGMPMEINCKV
jgi:hypothetical protein